ncbi:MAG: deoxyguanosinetriphosphate triphosphohydrolase [Caldilineaceae bacterium SB0661_bin_32]|uniref:Deoxyguanosinetriphosphate triphosphohydrolase-like protein n=1 Tax=Caldilineaceae bacterium SB0661_bin_32 TaxID=2605255 RepID=A0A6B1D3M6_9CHLR|nr:deoxyguanosinetriphosphate triphosphohydrolase [Caldilineaceae bacterium SB0661_bin_32]
MVTREELEQREARDLAAYAMPSCRSRGRAYPAAEHPYRTAYQRDRDRIIHTTAFRRLQYKTQVFVYNEGDHYRNRLTHTIEVAQIGRTLARTLSCNEDLTEAICLAHDLGHPPFGHTGEVTLDDLMRGHGGYDHQKQTYRIITRLERRYPEHPGLNLTYEVREGVVKHDTDYDIVDARDYNPDEMGTLECQVSNLADEIAYNTSDSDDGLRAGILDPSAFLELAISRRVLDSLGESANSIDLTQPLDRYRFIRRLVGIEVNDAIRATAANLRAASVRSIVDLRAQTANAAAYSDELAEENRELKRFLFDRFYRHYRVARMAAKADRTIRALFSAFVEEPAQLPPETQANISDSGTDLHRVVCDYIAGMTDRYAIAEHRRLFDPEEAV